MPFPPVPARRTTYSSVLMSDISFHHTAYTHHTLLGDQRWILDACSTVLKYLLTDKIKHLDKKHEYLQIIQENPIWFAKTSVHVT